MDNLKSNANKPVSLPIEITKLPAFFAQKKQDETAQTLVNSLLATSGIDIHAALPQALTLSTKELEETGIDPVDAEWWTNGTVNSEYNSTWSPSLPERERKQIKNATIDDIMLSIDNPPPLPMIPPKIELAFSKKMRSETRHQLTNSLKEACFLGKINIPEVNYQYRRLNCGTYTATTEAKQKATLKVLRLSCLKLTANDALILSDYLLRNLLTQDSPEESATLPLHMTELPFGSVVNAILSMLSGICEDSELANNARKLSTKIQSTINIQKEKLTIFKPVIFERIYSGVTEELQAALENLKPQRQMRQSL